MKRAWFGKERPSNDIEGLEDFVQDIPSNCKLLEVGTLTGASAIVFAKKCKEVITIDGWDLVEPYGAMTKERLIEAEKRYKKYVKRYYKLRKKITQIKALSCDAAQMFDDRSFDVVYLDGNHFYEPFKEDLLLWIPKLKEGGILAGHDYQIKHVPKALEDVIGKQPDKTYKDGSWAYFL